MNRYTLAACRNAEDVAMFASFYTKVTGKMINETNKALVLDVISQASIIDKINLDRCNGIKRAGVYEWSERDETDASMAEHAARQHCSNSLRALFTENEFEIEWNCDPRGSSVRVMCGGIKHYV